MLRCCFEKRSLLGNVAVLFIYITCHAKGSKTHEIIATMKRSRKKIDLQLSSSTAKKKNKEGAREIMFILEIDLQAALKKL